MNLKELMVRENFKELNFDNEDHYKIIRPKILEAINNRSIKYSDLINADKFAKQISVG